MRLHFARAGRAAASLAAALLVIAPVLAAQAPLGARKGGASRPDSTVAAARVEVEHPASPRAMVRDFARLVRRRDYAAAARHLDLAQVDSTRGAELAERLGEVLAHHFVYDLEAVSPLAQGDTTDDANDRVEILGQIPSADGTSAPVRLVRGDGPDAAWRFGPATVGRIDAWYDALPNAWARNIVPAALQRPVALGLQGWQVGALCAVPLVAWLLGVLLVLPLGALVRRITARTGATWDDVLADRLRRPARLMVGALVATPLLQALGLPARLERWTMGLASGLVVLGVLWMLLRATRLLEEALAAGPWGTTPQGRSLIPLLGRIVRAFLGLLALLVSLSLLGYPVSTLLAGLGIGGIAVALAAQKTIENLFGSLSIAADRAFRVGDWVSVDGIAGTVEQIGLRSTAIRTLARSVVRIPNGRLAEMRIENFGLRDRFVLEATLGLTYDTSMPQLQRIMAGIEAAIRAHPHVWPDVVTVRFVRFGESSLEVLVQAWLLAADMAQFREWQQALLTEFHAIVRREGASFAFPTRTLHVVGDAGAAAAVSVTAASVRDVPDDAKAPRGTTTAG